MNSLVYLTLFLSSSSTNVPGPAEIAVWALEDAESAQAQGVDVSGFRYIWVHRRSEEDCIQDARVIDLAPIAMAISKSSNIQKAHRVNTRLLRIDLYRQGVTVEKSEKLIKTWEKLRDLDHYLTADDNELLVDFVEVVENSSLKVGSEIIRVAKKGEKLKLGANSDDSQWIGVTVDGKQAFISKSAVSVPDRSKERTIGPQCGQAGVELANLTDSDIPIVRHDMLLRSIMHGDIVLRPVGEQGGLYYEFLQIDKSPTDSDETDLQTWLEAFGADLEESQKLSADTGTIIVRSNVTGRSRAAVAFRGRSGRPGESTGVIFGTFDQQDGDDFDADFDPTENILGFKHKASEWIAILPNGTQAYGLFAGNAEGQNQERQDFAPDDVAVDNTVPRPHGSRLVVGMCFRCHNIKESDDGYKSMPNDLAKLLAKGRDIVTDRVSADTIAARYSREFEPVIDRSRDDHAASVFRITRDPINKLPGMEPFEAFGQLSQIYQRYWYDLVTTEEALFDMGILLNEGELAEEEFTTRVEIASVGEAAPLVYLASGIAVNRWQWESVYPEAILRVQSNAVEKSEAANE